ncbi:MAG: prolipoprotein diacylglyceryl transferase [candidate division Zixibacteria bacterium]|nr:prolipoprotein diacylglyceryl transferase [candidate division Zixibacteria bacterium]
MSELHDRSIAGKFMYGSLFVVVLPAILIIWSKYAVLSAAIPAPLSPWTGVVMALAGCGLMISGTVALWVFGRGLPMNPYPPSQFVNRGIYKYLGHPLYVGFCLASVGLSVALDSASGFWLVTPVVALSCTALVYGYERIDMDRRFGENRPRPLLRLPDSSDNKPSMSERVSVLLLLIVWCLAYELTVFVAPFRNALNLTFNVEHQWPVLEWTVAVYGSVYGWVVAAPLLAGSRRQLREFAVTGIIATIVGTACFFILPVAHAPRPFEAQTPLGQLLIWGQHHDSAYTAFPAFHLIWALLVARLFSARFPRLIPLWWVWAAVIGASCVTTGMHSMMDLLGALVLVVVIWGRHAIWAKIRQATESFANSWRAWRIGPVRIINHSMYAGLAGFVGYAIVAILRPDIGDGPILTVCISGIIGGALFVQLVEGSPRLLRPFGYFGAIVGSGVGVIASVLLFGVDGMSLLVALAVAAPFLQAVGRLRCLVQGCCHGRLAANAAQGIRYVNPSTRVVHLAELANAPIYPTPLYSIAGNLIIGLLLIRLWSAHLPESLIAGVYFLLTGICRFVEEAYRGEPQTPMCAGLRSYQWWSITFVVIGAVLTCIPSASATEIFIERWDFILPAILSGIFWGAATGVDLPESNARYARLTG